MEDQRGMMSKMIFGGGRRVDREVVKIPLHSIRCGRFQPRFNIDEESLKELAESIKSVGVLQPVVVRPCEGGYELIAGERRMRASMMAGLQEIPAVVKEVSDAEAAEMALVENVQRRNLHFFEEAEGFRRLIEQFDLTQVEVAEKMGLSQSAVANKLRLLRLPPEVREQVFRLGLSERHARALLELEDKRAQLKVLELAATRDYRVGEWEELIKREKNKNISREIKKGRKQKLMPKIRDLRIFMNSLERGVKLMRNAGLDVRLSHEEENGLLRIVIEVDTGV